MTGLPELSSSETVAPTTGRPDPPATAAPVNVDAQVERLGVVTGMLADAEEKASETFPVSVAEPPAPTTADTNGNEVSGPSAVGHG